MHPPLLIEAGYSTIPEEGDGEEADSFFDLEINLPHSHDISSTNTDSKRSFQVEDDELESGVSDAADRDRYKVVIFQQSCVSVSPVEKSLSKRRILPMEGQGLHRTQSPISLLKSAPKLNVFMFAVAKKEIGTKQDGNRGSPLLALKFKLKEIQPFFARSVSSSSGRNESIRDSDTKRGHCSDGGTHWKRFPRDVIQKYLRFIKPLCVKASKKQDNSETSAAASASSPLLAGSGTPSKQLGKSRSASAAMSSRVLSPARMDDSLFQHHDGIQSAILHCKRSLGASS